MSSVYSMIDVGDQTCDLVRAMREYADRVHGPDEGPGEVVGELKFYLDNFNLEKLPNTEDYGWMLGLVFEAARRAGTKPLELLKAANRYLDDNHKHLEEA